MIIPQSTRLDQFQEYFFATANRIIAETEKKTDKKVLNLGIGSPDLPPKQEVIECLKKELDDPLNHRYPTYTGDISLRKAIASYYAKRFSVQVDPNTEILPLIGSKEGLVNVCFAFMNSGDVALIPNPGYPAYTAGPLLADGSVLSYPLNEKNHWLPDLVEIEKFDLSKVKIWWIGYPNNPTGAVCTKKDMALWVQFARRHKVLLLYDNPYAEVYFTNKRPPSIMEIAGAKEIAIEFNSLSKTYNLAGWRIGMAISCASHIQTLLKVKSNIDTGIFTALQKAAAFAIEHTDEQWIHQRNSVYKQRRDLVCRSLKKMGFSCEVPQASLYVWAKSPVVHKKVEELSFELIKHVQVFVTPGTAFGSEGKGYFRISLCQSKKVIQEAMERLEQYFKKYLV